MDLNKHKEMKSKTDEEKNAAVLTKNHESLSTGAIPKRNIQFKNKENKKKKEHESDEKEIKKLLTGDEMRENFLRSLKPQHQKALKQVSESEKARSSTFKNTLDYDAEIEMESINLYKRNCPFSIEEQKDQGETSSTGRPDTPPPHTEDCCYWNMKKRPRYEYDDDDDHLLIDLLCEELAEISLK